MLQIVPFDYQKYYYMQTILWYLDIRVEWHVIFNPIQQKSMEKSNQTFQTRIAKAWNLFFHDAFWGTLP